MFISVIHSLLFQDGLWQNWLPWNTCSQTCGEDIIQERTRQCERARYGGIQICYPSTSLVSSDQITLHNEQRPCQIDPCPSGL